MRRLAAPVALVAVLLVSGCASGSGSGPGSGPGSGSGSGSGSGGAGREATQLPGVTLASFEDGGTPLALRSLRGPAVVNLWASWCGPCKRELPYYAQLSKKYAGKLDVVGIDFQETKASAAQALVRDTGVDYPLYLDPDGALRAIGLPKVILVDAAGKVVFEKYVEITSLAQLEKLVSDHLEVGA